MDEQALLHKISVDTDVNIEILKDFLHDERIHTLIVSGKEMDAVKLIRDMEARVGLREALSIVRSFSEEMK